MNNNRNIATVVSSDVSDMLAIALIMGALIAFKTSSLHGATSQKTAIFILAAVRT
jgi:hypothetical protein